MVAQLEPAPQIWADQQKAATVKERALDHGLALGETLVDEEPREAKLQLC